MSWKNHLVAGATVGLCLVAQAAVAQQAPAVVSGQRVAAGQAPQIELAELKQNVAKYLDQRLTMKGTLRLAGANYFRDSRFVLSDEAGNQVAVAAWAPLETPPPPPGAPAADRPTTMRDYLNKPLIVTGTFRQNVRLGRTTGTGLDVEAVSENTDARTPSAPDRSAAAGASNQGVNVPDARAQAASAGAQAPVAAGATRQGVPISGDANQTPPPPVAAGSTRPATPVPGR